jgi:hypothetical protein
VLKSIHLFTACRLTLVQLHYSIRKFAACFLRSCFKTRYDTCSLQNREFVAVYSVNGFFECCLKCLHRLRLHLLYTLC